jgi:hypothetical protein
MARIGLGEARHQLVRQLGADPISERAQRDLRDAVGILVPYKVRSAPDTLPEGDRLHRVLLSAAVPTPEYPVAARPCTHPSRRTAPVWVSDGAGTRATFTASGRRGPLEITSLTRSQRRESSMCANCGCGIPEDKHGDDRNITWSEIVASAEANDQSPIEAVGHIQEMAEEQTAGA